MMGPLVSSCYVRIENQLGKNSRAGRYACRGNPGKGMNESAVRCYTTSAEASSRKCIKSMHHALGNLRLHN